MALLRAMPRRKESKVIVVVGSRGFGTGGGRGLAVRSKSWNS
jgi:hypothetical protein